MILVILTKQQACIQIMASPDLQLKTYAIFSLSSGAKRKEICDLKWEQIDFEKRIAKIENNNLYFSERASNLLKELKNERKAKELIGFDNDAGYVFRSAYSAKMFSKKSPISTSTLETWGGLIGRLIDIPNFSHGDFRYTAISSFLSKSGSVGMASVIFNYPSLSSNVDKFIRNEESNDILQEYKDICEI